MPEPLLHQSKADRLRRLREQITELCAIVASEAGGLTEEEADQWWDECQEGLTDAFMSVAEQS